MTNISLQSRINKMEELDRATALMTAVVAIAGAIMLAEWWSYLANRSKSDED